MSGLRQHFFPKFLKIGFASRSKKKQFYTWVFRKNKTPYETNINNVGLVKHFYGSLKDSHVDDLITNKENDFANLIRQLRSQNKEVNLDPLLPSQFITHLIVRTHHIRQSIADSGRLLFDIYQINFKNYLYFKKLLLHLLKSKPEMIENSLKKEFIKKLPPNTPPSLISKFIELSKPILPKLIEQQHELGYTFFNQIFNKLFEQMNSIAKKSQIDALSEDIVPKKHLEKFKSFNWKLFIINNGYLISGDIGPIGLYKPHFNFQPFLFPKGEIYQALLPISDTHIIIGSPQVPLLTHTFDQINEAIASLSRSYFIGSKLNQKNLQLSNLIGSKALNISDSELIDSETQLRKDFFGE